MHAPTIEASWPVEVWKAPYNSPASSSYLVVASNCRMRDIRRYISRRSLPLTVTACSRGVAKVADPTRGESLPIDNA